MASYPISVKRDCYKGRDKSRSARARAQNKIAALLEKHINDLAERQTTRCTVYHSVSIARQLGLPKEVVVRLCMSIDGGHNGFMVVREDIPEEPGAAGG